MSSFTTPADLRMLDDYKWQVLAPFKYYVGDLDSEDVISVPHGYVTDLASVPRILWAIFPPHGKWAKAAIIHDYLYSNATKTKAYADSTFKEAMGVLDVGRFTQTSMYWAVRLFGRGSYTKENFK